MENSETLRSLFDDAKNRGLCHNQNEFAKLLKTDVSTLSNCLHGKEKYSSTVVTLIDRARVALAPSPDEVELPADGESQPQQSTTSGDCVGRDKVCTGSDDVLLAALGVIRDSQALERETQSQMRDVLGMLKEAHAALIRRLGVLLLLLAPVFCFAQYEGVAPVDSRTGLVTYARVVDVEGVSAGDLYARVRAWVSVFYKGVDVLDLDDASAGRMVGQSSVLLSNNGGRMSYSLTIGVKDGRCRLVLDHWSHAHLPQFAGQVPDYGRMETWVDGSSSLPKYVTKRLPIVAGEVSCLASEILDSFDSGVKVSSVDDDW